MALKSLDPSNLPDRTSTGGQSSIPEAEQAQTLEIITSGQSVSDGTPYESTKEATKAASPYKRFVMREMKAGNLAMGAVRIATFPVDKKGNQIGEGDGDTTLRGWAVFIAEGEVDEAAAAE